MGDGHDVDKRPTPATPNPGPRRTSATPLPHWQSALDWLVVALWVSGLLLGAVLPSLLPADWPLDARHNLSDIGFLLFLAGAVLRAASALLTDRRQWFADTCQLLGYWSMRMLLLGIAAFAPFALWLTVANLVGPPLRLSFPTSLPSSTDFAMGAALCLSLLGGVLAVPEFLWRSWRERRARRAAGTERR
jgi:hypothetical protein